MKLLLLDPERPKRRFGRILSQSRAHALIFPRMEFISRLSPVRAYKDLRRFFVAREPYELGFLLLAMIVTTFFLYAFAREGGATREYRPDIIYVEQYRLDRTDAEIVAQQKIDGAAKEKRIAERQRLDAERQASFKRLDDKLKSMGL